MPYKALTYKRNKKAYVERFNEDCIAHHNGDMQTYKTRNAEIFQTYTPASATPAHHINNTFRGIK